ncbi:MAG: outer membrane beta-barrel protein [Candidatus Eisenbacteria bacterium]|nr:outer membrane beta-barrel protein [Candidatus Eisenbacteria bacterium]
MKNYLRLVLLSLLLVCFRTHQVSGEERKGTISMGFQYQYSLMGGVSEYADNYDGGIGYGIKLKYYLGKKKAIGISFENQYHDATLEPATVDDPGRLQFNTTTVEFFRYFERNKPVSRYVVIGAGLCQPTVLWSAGGPERTEDGPIVTAGAGTEFFISRSIAVDFRLKGSTFVNDDGLTAAGFFSVGFAYYVVN